MKFRYLRRADILLINKLTVERHGGNYVPPENLLNESGLEFVIEAVSSKIFDEEMYPTLSSKAALYLHSIVSNHVFQDGNKRTGLEASLLFLRLNNCRLNNTLVSIEHNGIQIPSQGSSTNEILFHFIIELASGKLDVKACTEWFDANIYSLGDYLKSR